MVPNSSCPRTTALQVRTSGVINTQCHVLSLPPSTHEATSGGFSHLSYRDRGSATADSPSREQNILGEHAEDIYLDPWESNERWVETDSFLCLGEGARAYLSDGSYEDGQGR